MKPVRRYLGPRLEFPDPHTSVYCYSSVCTVDSYDLVHDEIGLRPRLKTELGHFLNERFYGRLHSSNWRALSNRDEPRILLD